MSKNKVRLLAASALVVFASFGFSSCFGGKDGCPTIYNCGPKHLTTFT